MAASDITVSQDGGHGAKLHPYLVTLVRWCVSCLWSTATVMLHRLLTTPLPSITASKPPSSKPKPKPRPAGTEHLHPEPKVECVVLHQPSTPTLDVIFVHGLYGSLGNTWRQGEWKLRYKNGPNKVTLRNHNKISCQCKNTNKHQENIQKTLELNKNNILRIIPNEETLITERFYDNNILNQIEIVDNYETQAQFVRDLFTNETKNQNQTKNQNGYVNCHCDIDVRECDVGCGCVCDGCYSPCWPKDWLQVDFPGARVISVNYTSDPYLWRPLWVKGNKRLRLHERAGQMMEQLLALGVGELPIVWVGHSKGGLYIKQIYCDAFDAYLEMNKDKTKDTSTDHINRRYNIDNNTSSVCIDNDFDDEMMRDVNKNILVNETDVSASIKEDRKYSLKVKSSIWTNSVGFMFYSVPHRGSPLADIKTPITARSVDLLEISKDCSLVRSLQSRWLVATGAGVGNTEVGVGDISPGVGDTRPNLGDIRPNIGDIRPNLGDIRPNIGDTGPYVEETRPSVGEIRPSVGDTGPSFVNTRPRVEALGKTGGPCVRSLVETGRTLMSVLWLRIVSVDSADAGIGSLSGVSVDHREICKPSSRYCPLYTELTDLIREALNKCQCQ